ncbi:MAG: hypothetical protein ACUVWP_01580 [bacterium]
MSSPILKIYNKDNGLKLGNFSKDPFGSSTIGIEANKNDKLTLYAGNGSGNTIKKWDGSEWNYWANCGVHPFGTAFGWNHVFVVLSSTPYSIEVFDLDGNKITDIRLNNWDTGIMYGLCRGRDNVVGENDSLYITVYYPSVAIKEIEIGDYNTVINTTSIGDIKAIFH